MFNRLLGRWRGAIAAGIGIALYALLVGAAPGIVRAALMSGLSLFARQVGRRQDGVNSLAVVAAFMALFNPNVLWDVGFQLSVMTTLGLILYADSASQSFIEVVSRRFPLAAAQRLSGPVGVYFLFTLAAQITGLPITFYYFRRLSLSSLVANPLILPAQPPVMILGGLAVILGLVYEPLGRLAAYLAWPFVGYTIRVVELIARVPGGVIILGRVGILLVLVYYGIVLGGTFVAPLIQKLHSSMRNEESSNPANNWTSALALLSLLGLVMFNVVAWREVSNLPDGKLHMTVLDVSDGTRQGDAILIQSPSGRAMLINGGPSPNRLSDALGRRLPLFHRELDYLILADPVADQIEALSYNIQRFPPANVLWAGPLNASREARSLRESLVKAGIPIAAAETGQTLVLGSGARLRFLKTGKRGAILCLEWKHFRALLPIGANFEDLEYLDWGREVGPVNALLSADHGYSPANPPNWIGNLHPQVLLQSGAAGDARDLDSLEFSRVNDGYFILSTARNGWIRLSTDGEKLWLEIEKSNRVIN
jgi:competence protein ComEC